MISTLRIMRVNTAYPQNRRPRRRAALGLAGAILSILVLATTTATAAGPPVIESVGSGYGAEVTVKAKINPDGLETTYQIGLECSTCGPIDQSAEGTLPAVYESREIMLALTDPQPGLRYQFVVHAGNADGETSQHGETLEVPPPLPSFPDGTSGVSVVEAPYLGAGNGQLRQIAEQEVQRRAKEQEEQKAKEAADHPLSELTHAEEQAHVGARPRPLACLVPVLKGDTPSAARRALHGAHCQLGAVHRPPHHHGTLRVSAQSAPAGKRLAHNARVALWVSAIR
jgi:hypothetical protein